MSPDWGREERPDRAVDRILDAADRAFAELGVSAAGMAEIARAAGCSRGTLYRYFKNRHELHRAYVKRVGLAIAGRVRDRTAGIEDPTKRIVAYVLYAVREVRRNPGTAAWFADGASGLGARMSQTPEVIGTLTASLGPGPLGPGAARAGGRAARRLRTRWLVRVIVSLLADPAGSAAEERALVERFVAPGLLLDVRSRAQATGAAGIR